MNHTRSNEYIMTNVCDVKNIILLVLQYSNDNEYKS